MTKQRKPESKLKTSTFENGRGFEKKLQQAQINDKGKIPVQIDNKTIKLINP